MILNVCTDLLPITLVLVYIHVTLIHCVLLMFQASPEVDDEGYSIRPDEESEEGDILSSSFCPKSSCQVILTSLKFLCLYLTGCVRVLLMGNTLLSKSHQTDLVFSCSQMGIILVKIMSG